MINILYAVVPIAFAIFVSIVWSATTTLAARGRGRRSLEGGIDEFSKELTALAPHDVSAKRQSWRGKGR
jgi:hypothetical protein